MGDKLLVKHKTKEGEPQEVSAALKAYTAVQDDLQSLLVPSLVRVTALAFSAKLIGDELEDKAMDKGSMPEQDRAQYLIRQMRKAISLADPEVATTKMNKFLQILKKEASQRPLAEKIEKQCESRRGEEATILIEFQADLAMLLQCNLLRTSTAAYSAGLISGAVKDAAVDPTANHDKLYTEKILDVIGKRIKEDPSNLDVFRERVMVKLGPFIDHITEKLKLQPSTV